MGRGIPLTPEQRRGLFEWILADGPEAVASDCVSSVDTLANWVTGICAPFPAAHKVLARKLSARADQTKHALREAARAFGT